MSHTTSTTAANAASSSRASGLDPNHARAWMQGLIVPDTRNIKAPPKPKKIQKPKPDELKKINKPNLEISALSVFYKPLFPIDDFSTEASAKLKNLIKPLLEHFMTQGFFQTIALKDIYFKNNPKNIEEKILFICVPNLTKLINLTKIQKDGMFNSKSEILQDICLNVNKLLIVNARNQAFLELKETHPLLEHYHHLKNPRQSDNIGSCLKDVLSYILAQAPENYVQNLNNAFLPKNINISKIFEKSEKSEISNIPTAFQPLLQEMFSSINLSTDQYLSLSNQVFPTYFSVNYKGSVDSKNSINIDDSDIQKIIKGIFHVSTSILNKDGVEDCKNYNDYNNYNQFYKSLCDIEKLSPDALVQKTDQLVDSAIIYSLMSNGLQIHYKENSSSGSSSLNSGLLFFDLQAKELILINNQKVNQPNQSGQPYVIRFLTEGLANKDNKEIYKKSALYKFLQGVKIYEINMPAVIFSKSS